MTDPLCRRRFLQAAGAALAAGVAAQPLAATSVGALPGAAPPARLPPARIGLLQTRARTVERTRPHADLQRNLQHMIGWIDAAQADGPAHDWLAFHQCPLTGWEAWTETEASRVAIELDGPEVGALAERARAYRCHLSFGALLRLADWPGRVVDATVFLSRSGAIESLQWVPLAPRACGGPAAITTISDVLDEYVERHGRPALLRIARTDIGDLCAAPTADDPALHGALARAGAQFVLRTHAGALPAWSLTGPACCQRDGIHGGLVNAAVATDLAKRLGSPTGGGSALHGPEGESLSRARDGGEALVSAIVRLGARRASVADPAV